MTAFETWGLLATGTTTRRSVPDRFGEVKNVKDFGALGNSSHDDTANIQAAVDSVATDNRGTIYFPPGRYITTSPVTFNYNSGPLSICFLGDGDASELLGDFAGYVLDRSLTPANPTSGTRVVEKLKITNGNAAGGAIRMGSSVGIAIRDCTIGAFRGISTVDSGGDGGAQSITINNCFITANGQTDAIGIDVGANCVISGCDITGLSIGIRASATSGIVILSPRIEVCGTGIQCGGHPNATYLTGLTVLGGTMESCGTAIDTPGALTQFYIGNLGIQGFEGAIPGNPQYGIRLRSESCFGTLAGVSIGGQFQIASISIADTTNRGGIVIQGCRASNASTLGGVPWVLPTKAHTAEFINCDTAPTYLYSGLPTGGNVVEGDRYYITDANTATLGDPVTAGGSPNTRGYVVYNGSAWHLMSK